MRSFLILSILFLMSSCYEKQEGCLDFRANNYDFGADESCEDCCTYPDMKIGITHYWGDTTLMIDSIYTSSMNQKIRIVDVQFFLSDIYLTNGSEKETVLETLSIEDANGVVSEIPNNYDLVQNTRFTYEIGTFNKADIYDGISFILGINGKYYSEEVEDYPSFFNDTTYEYTNFRLRYVLENVSSDTLLFELKGPETSFPLTLNAQLDIPLGIDFTIPLYADYDRLFEEIDFSNLESANEQTKLIANFAQFLRF